MDPLFPQYIERTVNTLVTAGAVSLETEIEELAENEAIMEATITFPQGFRLEVDLIVSLFRSTPIRRAYSFHFMDSADATIFRYDNARHHHNLEHFPHHKHIGADERIIGCRQPSIGQIRNEIAAHLSGESCQGSR